MIFILFFIGFVFLIVIAQKKIDAKKINQLRVIRLKTMQSRSKSEKHRFLTMAEEIAIWLEKKSFLPASKAEAKLLLESIKTFI